MYFAPQSSVCQRFLPPPSARLTQQNVLVLQLSLRRSLAQLALQAVLNLRPLLRSHLVALGGEHVFHLLCLTKGPPLQEAGQAVLTRHFGAQPWAAGVFVGVRVRVGGAVANGGISWDHHARGRAGPVGLVIVATRLVVDSGGEGGISMKPEVAERFVVC